MKTEFDENGTITISPETPLEAYALRKWSEQGEHEMLRHLILKLNLESSGEVK